jgi:hypothetical protein
VIDFGARIQAIFYVRLIFVQSKLFALLWFGQFFYFLGMKLARQLCSTVDIDASIHFFKKAITP